MSATDERVTVITRNADGELRVEVVLHAELIQRLNNGHYNGAEWMSAVDADPNYWPGENPGIILNGGPIVPTKVESVTRWELP